MLVLVSYTFSTTPLQAGTPKTSVTPMSVNFGNVKLGGTSEKTATIKNTGTSDLLISNISITGSNASEFSQTNDCTTIPAGGSCTVTVTFTPAPPFGKKGATVSISSNDPKKPTLNVKISGNAPPPKISATPMSVGFASVMVGGTSTKTITIKNTGASDLVISDISITGSNASEFSQTNDCTTVPSGGSCTITGTFTPAPPFAKKGATISVSSNDPIKPTLNVKISAQSYGCTYRISALGQQFDAPGGTGSVGVTALNGCNWTATNNNPDWITITSGGSGNGNGNVTYSVAAYTGTGQRTGTLTIAGQTFTVTQDSTPRGPLQLESYSYKAYLQYGGPLETIFTIQKPKGWEVIIANNICAYFGFLIHDPIEPLRQIFYFGTIRPVYMNQAQKDYEQYICSLVQPPCGYTWTDAPVVSPLTVDNFFSHWPEIASMRNAAIFMAEFPKLQGLELISVVPQSPMLALTGAETALVRGVFTNGDPVNPKAAQGQFLATVVADPPMFGTGSGYMVFGATTPVPEFKADIDKLVESLNGFTISNMYLNWCAVQMAQQWGAVADIGQTLREASDIIYDGWVNRTATQDIMAYEYNDSNRGVEKGWDPVTGNVYEFGAGWYDQYALNPGAYNISTLEPMPDNRIDLWEGTILNGPSHVYPQ